MSARRQQKWRKRYDWLLVNFSKLEHTPDGWLYDSDWLAGYAVDIETVIDAAIAAGKGQKTEEDES